jgi:hypothetical protein
MLELYLLLCDTVPIPKDVNKKLTLFLILQENLLSGVIFNRFITSVWPGEAGHLVQHVSGVGPNFPPLGEHLGARFEAVVLPGVLHDARNGFSQLAADRGDVVFGER